MSLLQSFWTSWTKRPEHLIYSHPDPEAPIRQGDIFRNVPRVEISLGEILAFDQFDQPVCARWTALLDRWGCEPIRAAVRIKPVFAIVITQDCDALRDADISLCEVKRFRDVYTPSRKTETAKGWMSVITKHTRANYGWFYLPAQPTIGFAERMGARFSSIHRVVREDLEDMRAEHRVARLNEVATAHFRERLSEFFRRYPYNEWYPLTKEELEEYRRSKPEPVEPYEWQE